MIPGWSRLSSWVLSVPIRVKIMGIALGMVTLLGLGVTLQVRSSMQVTLQAELQRRAAATARDVAGRAADLIVTNNIFALHELVRTTLEHNEDTRYVLVLDRSGETLAHTLSGNPSPELLRANLPALDEAVRIQPLDIEEGRIYDAAVPIFGGRAGVARVGMSDRRMSAIVAATTRRLLAVTALVSLGGVAAALLLTFVLTRPILALGKVAQAVGRGEFSQKAPVWSRDEVGRLTEAFNAMTEALDRSRRQILRRNAELSALNAIAVTVSGSLHLDEILEGALSKVLEVMNLRAAWIFLDEEGAQVLAASAGLTPDAARAQAAHASVPLKAKERVLGIMSVVTNEAGALSREDLNLLTAIGHQIALAVENARLYEEVQRKEEIRRQLLDKLITAPEEERRRVARELPDEVGQSITALNRNRG
ncbi:MAG: HAMP domain-containing protein, partial [Candidatus Methylomirabilis oxyfera]|nr:HAMP domain-containing protein [Candidatus Methylomirabilis oxyfera]